MQLKTAYDQETQHHCGHTRQTTQSMQRNLTDIATCLLVSRTPSAFILLYEQHKNCGEERDQGALDEEEADEWFGEGRAPFTPAERGSFERIARGPDNASGTDDGNSENNDSDNKCDNFRDWSLLICWPSDGKWPAGCLKEFQGDDFFYVGEAEGGATRMPWGLLKEEWELERRVAIPRWPGFKDALWWYRRKGAAALPPGPEPNR